MTHVIAPRGLRILGILGIAAFSVIGLVVVAHPGVDASLKGRLVAGSAMSVTIWLLWNLALAPRITLEPGVVAVHYPGMVRRIPAATIVDVRVERGDLVIRTADGRTAKPPTLRASVAGAATGNRGARSVRHQILDHAHPASTTTADSPTHTQTLLRPRLPVLLVPLAVLWTEAFLLH
ncbi:hypothetical protein ACWERV_06350 [Streptomyces sp. NPDC004031]